MAYMRVKVVFLPISKYRVGLGPSMDYAREVVPADTIFGALCWSFSTLYGEDECGELVREFNQQNPLFLISSGFPSLKSGNNLSILVPSPMQPRFHEIFQHMLGDRKARISYVTFEAMRRVANGSIDNLKIDTRDGRAVLRVEGEDVPALMTTREYKNVLDRLTKQSAVYRVAYVRLGARKNGDVCGICFFIGLLEGLSERKMMAMLRFVGELGLGGEKSLGLGLCQGDLEIYDFHTGRNDGRSFVTLSPYCPTREEAEIIYQRQKDVFYALARRTAYYNSLGIIEYAIFTEGSCFPRLTDKEVYGKMIVVDEKISRYGYAFPFWWDF